MQLGTIKRLTDKGFGFIDADGREIFFHMTVVEGVRFNELAEGQQVEYEEGEGAHGPIAEVVRPH